MSGARDAVRELSALFAQSDLPREFLDDFELLECLSCGRGVETYLARQKATGAPCVAKRYDKAVCGNIREGEILKTLCGAGLPIFLGEYRGTDADVVVRSYIEGTPLDRYARENELPKARIIALCAKLCDILACLHGLEPPVIHRDIKPQNVIVKDDGDVCLIDFDISRTAREGGGADTRVVGTRPYAPPEQYGFSQTDARADIYALGVLLCFLLTGSTDAAHAAVPDRRLAAVVRRCTAFSPERRFGDARAVKRALLRAGRAPKRTALVCAAAACAALALCAGLLPAARRAATPPRRDASSVRFAEPLVEQAVRAQLGKDAAQPLTREELLSVREIYIFGDEVARTGDVFSDGLAGPLGDKPRGTVETLRDVALLPNLEIVYVNYQTLSDIAPLAQLERLTYVDLRHTMVEDIRPLGGLAGLVNLVLYDTRAGDLSCLAGSGLRMLNAGKTPVGRLDALPPLPQLEALYLEGAPLDSLEGVERFPALRTLDIRGTRVRDLSPLAGAPALEKLQIGAEQRAAAGALADAGIEITFDAG
ncbi:MAG: protein kinase [Oscillospiraceae bacterium]|nr:protein kinase [Oscillospiraceae bacterium]